MNYMRIFPKLKCFPRSSKTLGEIRFLIVNPILQPKAEQSNPFVPGSHSIKKNKVTTEQGNLFAIGS